MWPAGSTTRTGSSAYSHLRAAIRKEAMDLDESAAELRRKAVETEQEAAKLRIKAWCVCIPVLRSLHSGCLRPRKKI